MTRVDYTKATKRQLYQIATDATVRMSERYKAVKEMQRRKGHVERV